VKEFMRELLAAIDDGIRDEFRFFAALIAAPIQVVKEYITSTGRFPPRDIEIRAQSGVDQKRE
jgi:hypothetical protein